VDILLPKIPLAEWIDRAVNAIYNSIGPALGSISDVMHSAVTSITDALAYLPWWIVVVIIAAIAYRAGRWRLSLGTAIGLIFIYDLRLWDHMITTLVLVILSALISVVIGLPLGIWGARSDRVYQILSPFLDLMQTMPAFVYLVPVLIFFNIGVVPAIFATVIFAMPPAIRLARLGILQVPTEMVEAARAFGANDRRLLWKIQIPLAMPSIKAGINQTLMLSLSMVVIASMIGAGGLGADVMAALETIDVGKGFEAGLSIVILAMILDRISQKMGRNSLNKRSGRNA